MYLCEYLPRLHQIAVTVETPGGGKVTRLALENNTLQLSAGDAPAVAVRLPVPPQKLEHSAIASVRRQPHGVALTLALAAPAAAAAPEAPFMALSAAGRWSVADLLRKTPRSAANANEFAFCCARCGAVVVDAAAHKFVDMPSEFWHEMMDFWHCHKPHQAHHLHTGKHYDGRLVPQPGFANIAPSYVLVRRASGACGCGARLGDVADGVLKIYKWNLTLRYGAVAEHFPPHAHVYAAVLDRVNSAATRKFALRTRGRPEAYVLWVVGVGLAVSFGGTTLDPCLKILYRRHDACVDDALDVPDEVWRETVDYMHANNSRLPASAQTTTVAEGSDPCEYSVCYLG